MSPNTAHRTGDEALPVQSGVGHSTSLDWLAVLCLRDSFDHVKH